MMNKYGHKYEIFMIYRKNFVGICKKNMNVKHGILKGS